MSVDFDGWHLKKEVSVGHILTTAACLLSALWWVTKTETRLAVVEAQISQERQRNDEYRERMLGALNSLRGEVRDNTQELRQRLDRLIEQAIKDRRSKE